MRETLFDFWQRTVRAAPGAAADDALKVIKPKLEGLVGAAIGGAVNAWYRATTERPEPNVVYYEGGSTGDVELAAGGADFGLDLRQAIGYRLDRVAKERTYYFTIKTAADGRFAVAEGGIGATGVAGVTLADVDGELTPKSFAIETEGDLAASVDVFGLAGGAIPAGVHDVAPVLAGGKSARVTVHAELDLSDAENLAAVAGLWKGATPGDAVDGIGGLVDRFRQAGEFSVATQTGAYENDSLGVEGGADLVSFGVEAHDDSETGEVMFAGYWDREKGKWDRWTRCLDR